MTEKRVNDLERALKSIHDAVNEHSDGVSLDWIMHTAGQAVGLEPPPTTMDIEVCVTFIGAEVEQVLALEPEEMLGNHVALIATALGCEYRMKVVTG